MDLSQWAFFFREEGNITSKDNYRNTNSLRVSGRWQKLHCSLTFGQSTCYHCSQDFFYSPTKYCILLSFSLNTKVILSHNFLFGYFKKRSFFPKPCLKKKPCGLVIFFYTNNNFSSYKDTKLWPFRVGKGEGKIGSKRRQNLKLWFWGNKKTFYKVVVAVCFWTHWNKWHRWFQNWKSQVKFSKREIQIKIFENSLLL